MKATRILVACELRSYCEVVAMAFQQLRPRTEVFEAEPRNLNREVLRLQPDLVVCSRVTQVVKERVSGWIELYPDCGPHSVVYVDGECSTVEDMQLSNLLSIVDQTAERATKTG